MALEGTFGAWMIVERPKWKPQKMQSACDSKIASESNQNGKQITGSCFEMLRELEDAGAKKRDVPVRVNDQVNGFHEGIIESGLEGWPVDVIKHVMGCEEVDRSNGPREAQMKAVTLDSPLEKINNNQMMQGNWLVFDRKQRKEGQVRLIM